MTETKHPEITVQLLGQDGNAFNVLGLCKRAMERNHLPQEEINQFIKEATSGNYDHLIATVMSWFDID